MPWAMAVPPTSTPTERTKALERQVAQRCCKLI
jgi:hypothetical protein